MFAVCFRFVSFLSWTSVLFKYTLALAIFLLQAKCKQQDKSRQKRVFPQLKDEPTRASFQIQEEQKTQSSRQPDVSPPLQSLPQDLGKAMSHIPKIQQQDGRQHTESQVDKGQVNVESRLKDESQEPLQPRDEIQRETAAPVQPHTSLYLPKSHSAAMTHLQSETQLPDDPSVKRKPQMKEKSKLKDSRFWRLLTRKTQQKVAPSPNEVIATEDV